MWRDLKFALRMLGRERLLSAVVVVTAALGIGGSTAVFSVVSAVLIRDLPYSNAGQLYVMRALAPDGLPGNVTRREFAPIYERENHPTVETASIAWSQASQIVGSDRRPHPTVRYGVTDRFFDVFGVRMALGRGFQPGEQLGRIVHLASGVARRVWLRCRHHRKNSRGRRPEPAGRRRHTSRLRVPAGSRLLVPDAPRGRFRQRCVPTEAS